MTSNWKNFKYRSGLGLRSSSPTSQDFKAAKYIILLSCSTSLGNWLILFIKAKTGKLSEVYPKLSKRRQQGSSLPMSSTYLILTYLCSSSSGLVRIDMYPLLLWSCLNCPRHVIVRPRCTSQWPYTVMILS